MKRISTVALAALIAAGYVGAVSTAPAFAQKKQEEKKGSGLKLTPEVQNAAAQAQPLLQAKDIVTAEPLVATGEAAVKTDDDRYVMATLRASLETTKVNAARAAGQQPDVARLATAFDALLQNPKTPQATKASIAVERGLLAYNSRQYAQAIQYWQQAQQLGYTNPDLASNITRARIQSGDTAGATAEVEKLIAQQTAAGQKPAEDQYRFALSTAVQSKNVPAAVGWMQKLLVAYPTPKNWRDMIKIYGLQQGSLAQTTKAQQLDLYRLMRANRALADQYDYEQYARFANDVGLPWEAKAVITEGRAAGKVPAGAGNGQTLLATANASIAAEGSLTALEGRAKSAADGKLASQTGDAQLASGNYAKAVELYRAALQKGGVATDDVNTRLGIALAMTGDKAGAKTAFGAVTASPRKEIAALWTTHVDAGSPTAAPAPAATGN